VAGLASACYRPATPARTALPLGSRDPATASGFGFLRHGSTALGRARRYSPMPSPRPCRAWTLPGSGWLPSFASAWTASLVAPSGRSAWSSTVPPARARQLLWNAVSSMALAPLGPDPTWSGHRRACGIAVHLPRRNLNAGLAGERLPRSRAVRISSYFRTL
jgi:hypothetical protein